MVLKLLFFQKITKNRPAAGGFAPSLASPPDPHNLGRLEAPLPDPRL